MEDFPWPYVVVIFIAFISWVYNKLQEAAAERRRRRVERMKGAFQEQKPVYQQPEEEPLRPSTSSPPPIPTKPVRQIEQVPSSQGSTPRRPTLRQPTPAAAKSRQRRKRKIDRLQLDLADTLGSRQSLRKMLIVSEILGKPKSLH
ncbi:MAG: hypothetical protein HKN23_21235 [Verrucomicrobiales bacterium]|nr:hypothetical protein [Verrucomicrobiales bacterium]